MRSASHRRIRRALLWKEWREQRWRAALSIIVLTTLAGSLIRAQLLTLPEATVLVFVPASVLLAIFLSMGLVATEREDGTWPFLASQPVSRATVLRVKWRVGAGILAASFVTAAFVGFWAARSRGLFDLPPPPSEIAQRYGAEYFWIGARSFLWRVGVCFAAGLAFHALLSAVLARARAEMHAGIGGLLLFVVALAWSLQREAASIDLPGGEAAWQRVLRVTYVLSPLSPLSSIDGPTAMAWVSLAVAAAWVALSLRLMDRIVGERE